MSYDKEMLNEAFGGIFGDIFGSAVSPSDYEEDLDEYWSRGQVKEYWNLVHKLKDKGYKILKNDAGKHRVRSG